MKARAIVLFTVALILLLAGVSACKITWEGIRDGDIMTNGRRSSRLVTRERDAGSFWIAVGFNGVMGSGMIAGAGWAMVSAIRGPRLKGS